MPAVDRRSGLLHVPLVPRTIDESALPHIDTLEAISAKIERIKLLEPSELRELDKAIRLIDALVFEVEED